MNRRELLGNTIGTTLALGLVPPPTTVRHGVGRGHASATRHLGELRADDGTLLFHRDWGSGRPVLFLHGWGLNSLFWEYQMEFLVSRGFRAVAFDRRSHGRSGDPGRGYDFDTLSDDVARAIDDLGLAELTLVGHSLGGAEAVRYLTRHGSARVARLVLVGATLPFLLKTSDNPTGVDLAAFDAMRAALGHNRAQWLADNSAPFWAPDSSPELMAWGRIMPWQCSLHAMIALTRTMSEADFRSELARVRVPTLVIHGTADRSVPIAAGRSTASLITHAVLREYDGAPHGLPLTHMERFNAELLEFAAGS